MSKAWNEIVLVAVCILLTCILIMSRALYDASKERAVWKETVGHTCPLNSLSRQGIVEVAPNTWFDPEQVLGRVHVEDMDGLNMYGAVQWRFFEGKLHVLLRNPGDCMYVRSAPHPDDYAHYEGEVFILAGIPTAK